MKPIFQFAVLLLFLEVCYICYWFGSMWYLMYNGTERYRALHAFLAIHMVTVPIAIFYILEARKKKPLWFLLWVFIAAVFFDIFHLTDVAVHLDRSLATAFGIELAASIWTTIMSGTVMFWYMFVIYTGARENEKDDAWEKIRNRRYEL